MADQQQPGLLANILAVAGFFILIVIIVWGAYHLLRLTGSGLSSLFYRWGGGNAIEITLPSAPVQSGRAFTLSWNYEPEENGSYAFIYQCKPGFRFETTIGDARSAIPCGSAYTVGGMSLSLIPLLSGTSSLAVPLSVVFMPSGMSSAEQTRPQGNATLTVVPSQTGAAPSPSTGTGSSSGTGGTSTGTTARRPQTPGVPDLAVTILAVGVIDGAGNFVARAPVSQDEIAAVKFDIANKGTASTGTWYFTVQLPMHNGYTYTSSAQAKLTPGSHVENILRFKPIQSGGGTVTVNVDPTNSVMESNESNNSASQYMSAAQWQTYYYNQPYVY